MNDDPKPDYGNLTIYGRNPVKEALQDVSLQVLCLHLASSNKETGAIQHLRRLAQERDIPVKEHSKLALSRISRNSRQDQGVAADLRCPCIFEAEALLEGKPLQQIIALDRVNNPQNLGMAIRSIAASPSDGLLLSSEPGNTGLSPLVVKASAGTLLKTPIYRCRNLAATLQSLKQHGYSIIALDAKADDSLYQASLPTYCVFVLGNESDGVSEAVSQQVDLLLQVPMSRGVESLNLAVTAALVAFHKVNIN